MIIRGCSWLRLFCLSVVVFLTACNPFLPTPTLTPTASPTQTPTRTSAPDGRRTPTLSIARGTLPPAWTPTYTFTPRATRLPLSTPTAYPTFTVAQLCADFAILTPSAGTAFEFNAAITFSWTGVPRERTMAMVILREGTVEGLKLDAPFDGAGVFPVPLRNLSGSGTFEWRAYVIDLTYGAICEQRGTLIRSAPPYF